MKDAILKKGESWYTNMADVFQALDGAPGEYNWLITDYETLPLPDEKCGVISGRHYCWMTGEELTGFVMKNRQLQWVWAVLRTMTRIAMHRNGKNAVSRRATRDFRVKAPENTSRDTTCEQ